MCNEEYNTRELNIDTVNRRQRFWSVRIIDESVVPRIVGDKRKQTQIEHRKQVLQIVCSFLKRYMTSSQILWSIWRTEALKPLWYPQVSGSRNCLSAGYLVPYPVVKKLEIIRIGRILTFWEISFRFSINCLKIVAHRPFTVAFICSCV